MELWDDIVVIPPTLAAVTASFCDELMDLRLPYNSFSQRLSHPRCLSQDGRDMAAAHLLPRGEVSGGAAAAGREKGSVMLPRPQALTIHLYRWLVLAEPPRRNTGPAQPAARRTQSRGARAALVAERTF